MSEFTCEIPETEHSKPPHISGVPLLSGIPELDFPLKLEACNVRLWYGSEFRGVYSTDDYQLWLLAHNVIKIDSGRHLWVVYNATIVVDYHDYHEKE